MEFKQKSVKDQIAEQALEYQKTFIIVEWYLKSDRGKAAQDVLIESLEEQLKEAGELFYEALSGI